MRIRNYQYFRDNSRDTPEPLPLTDFDSQLFLDWSEWFSSQDNQAEYLTTYTELEAQLILSLLRLAEVPELWDDEDIRGYLITSEPYQSIKNAVEHLRYKFMTNISLEHLVKSNILLAHAITGRVVDFSTLDVETFLSSSHDYALYGLANRINQPDYAENGNTMADAIRNKSLSPTINNDVTVQAAAAPDVTVNNDVPVPSVTVEAALAPDVTVNFDTTAIATAIDNQADRIAPPGESLHGATIALADRVAPTGQTIYDMMELSRQQLIAISGKMAPDGENIKASLDDLQCICTYLAKLADINALSAPAMYLPIITKSSATAPVDALKCDLAKYHIAHHSQAHAEMRHYGSWFILAVEGSLAITGLFSKIVVKLFPAADEAIKRLLMWGLANVFDEVATPQNLYDFFDEYDDRVPELVCALYSACEGTDAITNLMDVAETFLTDTTKRIARAYFSYLFIYDIEKMFTYAENGTSDVEAQAIIDDWVFNSLNTGTDSASNPVAPAWAAGFASVDCSACDSCFEPNFSCMPQSGYMTAGVGTLFGDGIWDEPVGTWRTITSGVFAGSSEAIYFHPDDAYQIEIEILTMTGSNIRVTVEDCDAVELYNQDYVAPGNAGIHKGEIIKLYGGINSDTFTARFRRVT